MAASAYLSDADVEGLLAPGRGEWLILNDSIMQLPLPALRQLLEAEVRGRCRSGVVDRLYGRFSYLRALNERTLLMKGQIPWQENSQPQ